MKEKVHSGFYLLPKLTIFLSFAGKTSGIMRGGKSSGLSMVWALFWSNGARWWSDFSQHGMI